MTLDYRKINILLIEDDMEDVLLLKHLLAESSGLINIKTADSLSTGLTSISETETDIVLLDLGLPDSDGLDTIKKICSEAPQMPVIVMTGLDDEQTGIQAVNEGAQDYLIKGQVSSNLLLRSINYAIERKRIQNEREILIRELQDALAQIKTLSGLLPICASCKKIRDDKGYWNQIEEYVSKHSEAKFTHGICPECTQRLYPELFEDEHKK